MRWEKCILVLSCLMACGCQTMSSNPHKSSNSSPLRVAQRSNASALAYDPPVTGDQPQIDLDRSGRAVEAFVGYESVSATFFAVHQDDRQLDYRDGRNDRFERRAVSTKVGVLYR